jgi:hypothetical protein
MGNLTPIPLYFSLYPSRYPGLEHTLATASTAVQFWGYSNPQSSILTQVNLSLINESTLLSL